MDKYKDIFGKPNEGVHAYRIFGLAAVDVGMTGVLILAIVYFTGTNILLVFVLVMLITVCIHKLFGVDTALNVALGV